jgi:hypothetical protein
MRVVAVVGCCSTDNMLSRCVAPTVAQPTHSVSCAQSQVDDIIAEVTGGIALEKSSEMNAIGSVPRRAPASTAVPAGEEEDLLARLAALSS